MDRGKKDIRRVTAIGKILQEISDVLYQKLAEEPTFNGKIDFTVNCYRGGIGNVEAHSRYLIKNGNDIKNK